MTKEEYFQKAKYIWKNFVPKSGQADFVQGELLRAIEKLRDEAQRNGNINFYDGHHGVLIAFLREKLNDKKLFDKEIIKLINNDLDRLNRANYPYTEDDIYDRINDRIVDWFLHYGSEIKHNKNPNLPY